MTCLLYWLTGFRGEDFKTFFPIGSYVKTMSTEGGHLGWRSGSPDTILKIDHLRTIHAMFALNWLRPKKKICVFTVTRPTLIFASDPMHFYTEFR